MCPHNIGRNEIFFRFSFDFVFILPFFFNENGGKKTFKTMFIRQLFIGVSLRAYIAVLDRIDIADHVGPVTLA